MSMASEFYDYNGDDDDLPPTNKTCNYCGKGGLHWEDDNGKWILVTAKGEIHKCKPKPITLDLNKVL